MINRRTTLGMLAAGVGSMFGCGGAMGGGSLAVHSTAQPWFRLRGNFTEAVYRHGDQNTMEILMIEGTQAQPTQVVHLRMLWKPRAGLTPVDRKSTNATIRYVVFTGHATGIYEGAGFLFPKTEIGLNVFDGELRQASLRLQDHTENFRDRLGPAQASGSFTARHDPIATAHLRRMIQLHLRRELGYPRLI